MKTFSQRCPAVMVNNRLEMADYVVQIEHEGGKGWARKDNKVAVFKKSGTSCMPDRLQSWGTPSRTLAQPSSLISVGRFHRLSLQLRLNSGRSRSRLRMQ